MSRYGKVGTLGQVMHPRIRGALDPSPERHSRGKVARLEDYKADAETYFVPSFSIRRHLDRSEELLWETNQQLTRRRLGKSFTKTSPSEISLKVIEQHRFIKSMREAEIHPDPDEVRDLAYMIRDGLTNLLSQARSPLEIPLGKLNRFGYQNNVIGYEIDGWRGDRAQYGSNDTEGYMTTHGTLLAERQLSVGAIALAFGESELDVASIAPSPHVSIARSKETIPEYRMRDIRGELADLAIDSAFFSDPVIDLKLYRDMPSEPLYVKHSWASLGLRELIEA